MIKKADIVLIVCLLLFGFLLLIPVFSSGSKQGDTVSILLDGTLYGSYSLYEDRTIEINENGNHNLIEIKDGSVAVIESDCPGHECEHQGAVSDAGSSLVCLPHRLIIELSGASSYDTIVS